MSAGTVTRSDLLDVVQLRQEFHLGRFAAYAVLRSLGRRCGRKYLVVRSEFERKNDVEEFSPAFKIDGHPALMTHIRNARAYVHPKGYGISLHKGSRTSPRKIDLAVCVVGARMLRRLVLNKPEEEKVERTGVVW